jgi:hypothetical protein
MEFERRGGAPVEFGGKGERSSLPDDGKSGGEGYDDRRIDSSLHSPEVPQLRPLIRDAVERGRPSRSRDASARRTRPPSFAELLSRPDPDKLPRAGASPHAVPGVVDAVPGNQQKDFRTEPPVWPITRRPPLDPAVGELAKLVENVPGAVAAVKRVNVAASKLRPGASPEAFGAAVQAVGALGRTLADPVRLLRETPATRSRIEAAFQKLVDQIGPQLDGLDEALKLRDLPPLRLQVVAPSHDRLVVWEAWGRAEPRRVTTTNTGVVVQANNCRLEAKEHYRVRRISLDCEPLYRDSAVLDAFTAMMTDPSRANHEAFRSLVAAGRPEPAAGEVRAYGRDLAPTTALIADKAGVVAQGDDSRLKSTTCFHVEEAAISLTDLLVDNRDLVVAMAAQFAGEPSGAGDPLRIIRGMVGGLADSDLLTYADELQRGAEVTRSVFDVGVNLAGAVMVGYGNELSHTSRVDVSWSAGRALKTSIGTSLTGLRQAVAEARPHITRPPGPVRSPSAPVISPAPGPPTAAQPPASSPSTDAPSILALPMTKPAPGSPDWPPAPDYTDWPPRPASRPEPDLDPDITPPGGFWL